MKKPYALLVNPWIQDFAAYDLWCKPLGLLAISSWLKNAGVEVRLIDCLDRFHPKLLEKKPPSWLDEQKDKYYLGKFHKKRIFPPPELAGIDRPYYQYGLPEDIFIDGLKQFPKPDVILISSMMTFWYSSTRYMIGFLKELYPDTPIICGGVYPTLYYDHAKESLPADYIHKGAPNRALAEYLESKLGLDTPLGEFNPLIEPSFDLIHNRWSLSVISSVGCPFVCSYCASKFLQPEYITLAPNEVVRRLKTYVNMYNTTDVAFYDDALLYKADSHIIPILEEWIKTGLKLNFHTPNGLHARYITEKLAGLLYESGFKSLRLSLETTNKSRQLSSGGKIFSDEMETSLKYLYKAGFDPENIYIYLLIGMPGQTSEEIMSDIEAVHSMGAKIELANFTPIPNTPIWKELTDKHELEHMADPIYHNKSVFFLKNGAFDLTGMRRLRKYVSKINSSV